MVMPLSASFNYLVRRRRWSARWQAELHPDDAALRKQVRERSPSIEPEFVDPFLGPSPEVNIAEGTITIAGRFRLFLDPHLLACLRRNDVLRIARTGCGGLGVAILRREGIFGGLRVFAAVGAVSGVVVPPVSVRHVSLGERRDPSSPSVEGKIEIGVGGETQVLGHAQEGVVGDFGAVVLQGFKTGIPGTDECVAIFPSREPVRDAALASARLLANGEVVALAR